MAFLLDLGEDREEALLVRRQLAAPVRERIERRRRRHERTDRRQPLEHGLQRAPVRGLVDALEARLEFAGAQVILCEVCAELLHDFLALDLETHVLIRE